MSIDPKVSAFMSTNPTCVSPDTGIRTVIDMLNRMRQSFAVIVDNQGKPLGVVSARDLLATYAQGFPGRSYLVPDAGSDGMNVSGEPLKVPSRVGDMMTLGFSCVPVTARLHALRTLMGQMDEYELAVVVDDDGQACGLLTAQEFVKAFALVLDNESSLARAEMRAHNRALMQENEQLARLTMEDPMLRIGNRRAMMRDMHTLHARALRYGCRYAVLLVDIDYFKAYNASNGHVKGDEVLLQVVECLQTMVRDCDRVYRFGGEEFLVVLPETDVEGARSTADRIMTNMTNFAIPHAASPEGQITLSMGISAVKDATTVPDWHAVLEAADKALVDAKRSGRNQAQVAQVPTARARWCG